MVENLLKFDFRLNALFGGQKNLAPQIRGDELGVIAYFVRLGCYKRLQSFARIVTLKQYSRVNQR